MQDIFDLLCCPSTKLPLRLLRKEDLNSVRYKQPVSQTFEMALLRQDEKVLYPIIDGIPHLLPEHAIEIEMSNQR